MTSPTYGVPCVGETAAAEPKGGPWTRHGHPVPGVTVAGPGRPPIARCGGPGLCRTCAIDVARILSEARRAKNCPGRHCAEHAPREAS